MQLGYNTNGLAHHGLEEAIRLLGETGFECVAITIDHGTLEPGSANLEAQLERTRDLLRMYQMSNVIETGARFLLNPRIKHEPTLVSPDPSDRKRRLEFLCAAIDIAHRLQSQCVSVWSGIVHDTAAEEAIWNRLIPELQVAVEYADQRQVTLAFEPEPGMFIDTMHKYAQLLERIQRPSLRLTLDVGHLHCMGEVPLEDQIRLWGPQLANVHLEDMCAGVHEHLMFGEGEIDFHEVARGLAAANYTGPVNVELSRHSHMAPTAVRKAYDYLQAVFRK